MIRVLLLEQATPRAGKRSFRNLWDFFKLLFIPRETLMGSDRTHFQFGQFHLDAAERLLLRNGDPVPLAPKVFDTLLVLLQHNGHLLEKDHLMRAVWPDTFVEEVNLAVNISTLRKVLGELDNGRQYIETVPKRGYRFVAPIREGGDENELVIHNRLRARIVTEEVQEGTPQQAEQNQAMALSPTGTAWKIASLTLAASALVLGLVLTITYFRFSGSRAETRTPPALVNSIAVLPFKPLSTTGDDQYLELGIADELINRLSSLKQVVVRPTSAVRSYADGGKDSVSAGKELQVESVLEGNIQRLDDRIRVTVRLVSVPDGRALWSGRFDENLRDMFAVEDSISERVAEALIPKLTGAEKQLLVKHQNESAEAHDAYLKGRYFWNKRTADGINKAIEYFQQAIDREPNYARAYAGLADCYTALFDYQVLPPEDAVPRAKAAAAKALEIDPALAEAHTSLAYLSYLYDRNWAVADQEFLRAIELNPNYGTARHWHGRFLAAVGRFDEAFAELRRAQEIDPFSLIINTNLGSLFYFERQYDRAIETLQKTLEMEPTFELAHWHLGNCYERKQMYEKAIAEYQKALTLQGDRELATTIGERYKTGGFETAMRSFLDGYGGRVKEDSRPAYTLARYCAVLGDKQKAFDWLEKAYRNHHPWLAQLNVDPQFESLHSDPRFADLLRREGLTQ